MTDHVHAWVSFASGLLTCVCGKSLRPIETEEEMMAEKCVSCNGEGFTGSDDERAPWSSWESLPPGSDLAVQLGLVTKIECATCSGSGQRTDVAEVVSPAPELSPDERAEVDRFGIHDDELQANRTIDPWAEVNNDDFGDSQPF